ncbi:hypothetical protein SAMN04488071_2222 [Kordiimonas lacus]|uniref:Uncharacterized protein n=1 Tax=Kordiimonas lacus TaxID=637679 RepID=A0A1G7AWH8_9PROT|nr:hypothetical protein SAMN04488071_2222 [Kordiimonas lacus]
MGRFFYGYSNVAIERDGGYPFLIEALNAMVQFNGGELMRIMLIVWGAILGFSSVHALEHDTGSPKDLAVQITVLPLDQHIEVAYQLSHPVKALSLQTPDFPFRGKTWQIIASPDLILTKGTVRSISKKGFSAFKIKILPDQQVDFSGAVSVAKVDPDGFVFSYPELLPSDPDVTARLCVLDEPDVCDFETDETPIFQVKASGMVDEFALRSTSGILYVGPKNISYLDDVQRLVDDRLPGWLVTRQTDYLDRLIGYFGDELYFELSDPMVQVISWNPEVEEAGWSLGAYRNKASVLKFLGELPSEADTKNWKAIDYRLAEQVAVHFLNDYLVEAAGKDMKWFYLEVVPVLADEAWQTVSGSERPRKGWLRRITKVCIKRLPKSDSDRPRSCGTMLHLLADVLVQKETGGKESYIDLMRLALDIRMSEGISFKEAYLAAIGQYDKDGHIADLVAAINVNDAAFPAHVARTFAYLKAEAAGNGD